MEAFHSWSRNLAADTGERIDFVPGHPCMWSEGRLDRGSGTALFGCTWEHGDFLDDLLEPIIDSCRLYASVPGVQRAVLLGVILHGMPTTLPSWDLTKSTLSRLMVGWLAV